MTIGLLFDKLVSEEALEMINFDIAIVLIVILILIGILLFSLGLAPLISMEVLCDGSKKFKRCQARATIGAITIISGLVMLIIIIAISYYS